MSQRMYELGSHVQISVIVQDGADKCSLLLPSLRSSVIDVSDLGETDWSSQNQTRKRENQNAKH